MEEKQIRHIEVPCFMTDSAYKMKASSFMEQAQEIAMDGSDTLGFGYDVLHPMNMAWVLVRMQFKYLRAPMWRDKLTLRTWHKGVMGPYFVRDYEMLDEKGERVAVATSSWVVLNIVERSFVRMNSLEGIVDPNPQCMDAAIETLAPKVAMPRGVEPDIVASHKVVYSDLDFNGHTNNTKYISWAFDALPLEVSTQKTLTEVCINFNKEALLDEVVDLKCFRTENEGVETWLVEGAVEGRSSFTAKITF